MNALYARLIFALLFVFVLINTFTADAAISIGGQDLRTYHMFASAIFFITLLQWLYRGWTDELEIIFFGAYLPLALMSIALVPLSRAATSIMFLATPFVVYFTCARARVPDGAVPTFALLVVGSIAAGLMRLFVIGDLSSGLEFRYDSIFPGTTMETSYFYSLLGIVYTLFYARTRDSIYLVMIGVCGVFSLLGGTRSFILPLLGVIAATLTWDALRQRRLSLAVGTVLLGIVVLVGLTSTTFIFQRTLDTFSSGLAFYNTGSIELESLGSLVIRFQLWQLALQNIVDPAYVLQGRGLGSSAFLAQQFFGFESHLHNDILTLFYESGVLGTVAYYALLVTVLKRSIPGPGRTFLVLLVLGFEVLSGITSTNLFMWYPRSVFFIGLWILGSLPATQPRTGQSELEAR